MMRWIIESSMKYRFLVIVIVGALMVAGGAQLRAMPVDVLPEFAPPFVEVQTEALGLSAEEVEMLISLNLEELLNGTPWLQTIRSRSVPGLSSLLLIFEPGTDVIRARQLVQERLNLAYMLPNVSKPPTILQPLSATSRVMMVGLTSTELSPIEMSILARWKVRPALMGIPGVANVAIWGQRERQLQVLVDPERLRALGITLDQIISTTGDSLWVSPLSFLNASTPGTGGWIDTPQQRLSIRHVLPISAPDDLAQVVIEGADLPLAEVAQVVEDHQPLIGDAILSDGPGLLLVVEKFPGANTLEVTRAVEDTLTHLQPGLTGIQIDSAIFRPTSFIEMAMANIRSTLLVAAALAAVVLFAAFYNWRAALISLVTIPVSLLVAAFVLYLRGATFNAMVLAGLVIALGALIDDAIIDVDHIVRRLREHRQAGSDTSTAAIILEASSEMRGAVIFAMLIMLLAITPILFLEGVAGSFFRPLALSYALAVLASMLVALIVTPALSFVLFGGAAPARRESPLIGWLQQGHDGLLARTLTHTRLVYVVIGVLLLLGAASVPLLRQQSLLPQFREPYVVIQWGSAPGTSLAAMTRLSNQISRELQTIQGVRQVSGHVGRAVLSDQVVGVNSAQLWVSIDPAADYDATMAALQETVDGYPGVTTDVQTYTQRTLRQVLTGSSEAVVVRVYGPEFEALHDKAEEIRQSLAEVNGVVDLQAELQVKEPYVEIEVDLDKAEHYGIKPGDVRRAAATLVNGIEVGSLFEEQKVFEVVVWSMPATRNSLTDIRELLIDTPDGNHVRLKDVADVRLDSTLNTINREAVSRRVDVSFNVQGRGYDAVVGDVQRRLQSIVFPLEYHAEILGEYAERQAAQQRLLVVSLVAVIGIFLLFQAAFQSWRLASLAFLTTPLALVGSALAALFSGGALSLGVMGGLLAVFGIAVRNGVLLMRRYQQLEAEGEPFGPKLILRGTHDRRAPILITALTTALVLTPFIFLGANPGSEILRPMAIVILGGLVTSTALNLFIVPALYLGMGVTPQAATVKAPLQPSLDSPALDS